MDDQLTGERIRELITYDPGTGSIEWRTRWSKQQKVGPLGSLTRGYLHVRVGRKLYYAHRLIWLYHHDEWPPGHIDHINGDKLDNRIENLRVVTQQENNQNKEARGVVFDSRASRWYAQINVNGKKRHLGCFTTEEEALRAYREGKARYHSAWATGVGLSA